MKGLSPIVATVLLIVFTMSLAGVVAFWSRGLATGSSSQTSLSSQCKAAQFEFLNCHYNSSGQTVVFSLNNVKGTDISNMKAFVEYKNGTFSSEVPLNSDLPSGGIKSYLLAGIPSDFSKIVVKTNCPELTRDNPCST